MRLSLRMIIETSCFTLCPTEKRKCLPCCVTCFIFYCDNLMYRQGTNLLSVAQGRAVIGEGPFRGWGTYFVFDQKHMSGESTLVMK